MTANKLNLEATHKNENHSHSQSLASQCTDDNNPSFDALNYKQLQAIRSEEAVLGRILEGNKSTVEAAVRELEPSAFSVTAHRHIFNCIIALRNEGKDVDMMAVAQRLHQQGLLEAAGGQAQIVTLVERAFDARHTSTHIQEIKEAYQRKKCSITLSEIGDSLFDRFAPFDEVRKLVKKLSQVVEDETIDPDTRLKLDIQAYLQEADPIKRVRKKGEIQSCHRIGNADFKELLKAVEQRTKTPQCKAYSFAELLDEVSEGLNYLVPGMLPKGETVLLVAPPKTGKTLLAIDLAFAVATGGDFLGHQMSQGKVLIISVDESLQSTKSKLFKRGFRRQDSENVKVLPSWDISQLLELEAEIEEFRPDLIIVDSLKRITLGSDLNENSSDFADNIYKLKELFTKYGSAGILVHHSVKGHDHVGIDRARGSSAIAGATWGQWQLSHIPQPDPDHPKRMIVDPRNPHRTFFCYSRDTEGEALKLFFNADSNGFENLGQKELTKDAEKENQEEKRLAERVLDILKRNEHQALSGRDVIELLGLDKASNEGRAVYSALSRLTNKRIITQLPASDDKRYNLYSLPGSQSSQKVEKQLSQKVSHNFTPSPPPPPTVLVAEYYPENQSEKEFQNTQQNTQQILSKYSATPSAEYSENSSNDHISSNPEILSNFETEGGREGHLLHPQTEEKEDFMMTDYSDNQEQLLTDPESIDVLCQDLALIAEMPDTEAAETLEEYRQTYGSETLRLASRKLKSIDAQAFEKIAALVKGQVKPVEEWCRLKNAVQGKLWRVLEQFGEFVKVHTGTAILKYHRDELEFMTT